MDESSYADSVTDASSIFSRELCSKSGTFEDTMEIDDLAEIDVTGPYGPFSEVAAFRTGNITDSSIQEKDLNSIGRKFLTLRLSEFEILNDTALIFQNRPVSWLFTNIFYNLIFGEEHK